MKEIETVIDGWLWENFYFGNANYPSEANWRSMGDQYQAQVGEIPCNGVEGGRALWEYYKKPGMFDPFVTVRGTNCFLSWWEEYPKKAYEMDRGTNNLPPNPYPHFSEVIRL